MENKHLKYAPNAKKGFIDTSNDNSITGAKINMMYQMANDARGYGNVEVFPASEPAYFPVKKCTCPNECTCGDTAAADTVETESKIHTDAIVKGLIIAAGVFVLLKIIE